MKIIEATLILPLTCLIMIALIGFAMTFHTDLTNQVSKHEEDRAQIYSVKETTVIRTDRLIHQITEKED